MTPADTTSPPAARTPRARARSIHGPDSRVSRPMRILGPSPLRSRSSTRAVPSRAMVGGSSGIRPGHRPHAVGAEELLLGAHFFRTAGFLAGGLDPARRWTVTRALVCGRDEPELRPGQDDVGLEHGRFGQARDVDRGRRRRLLGPDPALRPADDGRSPGSISVRAIRKPGAARPRSVGWTSIVASAVRSSLMVTLPGEILTTSAPGGTAIIDGFSGYSCWRTVARSRSIRATRPDGPISSRRRLGARSVTSIVAAGLSTISSPAGMLRVSSGMVRAFSENFFSAGTRRSQTPRARTSETSFSFQSRTNRLADVASHRSFR